MKNIGDRYSDFSALPCLVSYKTTVKRYRVYLRSELICRCDVIHAYSANTKRRYVLSHCVFKETFLLIPRPKFITF